MSSCWGDTPNPKEHTTRNARFCGLVVLHFHFALSQAIRAYKPQFRTFLQPQLNKAAKRSELETKGDVNPKVRACAQLCASVYRGVGGIDGVWRLLLLARQRMYSLVHSN